MALDGHWVKVFSGMALYCTGLTAWLLHRRAQLTPDQRRALDDHVEEDGRQWEAAKTASQTSLTPPPPPPLPIPLPASHLPSLLLSALSPLSVREECDGLKAASMLCQESFQRRGLDRDQSMAQCEKYIDAFKACNRRKSAIDSRRGWMEQQLRTQAQPQSTAG